MFLRIRSSSLVLSALLLVLVLLPVWGARHGSESTAALVRGATCADIQAAIKRLPKAGGEVKLGRKKYVCRRAVVINRNNVTLRGQGAGTVLRLADHVNRPVLIVGQKIAVPNKTRRNIHIADLTIDGNRSGQDFECSEGPCTDGDFLRNNGISLRKVKDVRIEHVTVRAAKSGGLVAELGSRRITVRDFTAYNNELDGLAAYETEDSLFAGLHLHHNGAAGLSFDIRFDNNIVSDTVLRANGTVGVFARDSRDNLFAGLQISDSAEHGIFLAQVDTNETTPAAGNTFSGLVVSGSGGAGLRANDASCVDNLVVGAQFIGNAGGGISEAVPGQVTTAGVVER